MPIGITFRSIVSAEATSVGAEWWFDRHGSLRIRHRLRVDLAEVGHLHAPLVEPGGVARVAHHRRRLGRS